MAKRWSELSDKQKAKFGDNKAAFKQSKKQTREQGGNVEEAKDIVKTFKRNETAASAERANNNLDVEERAKQPNSAVSTPTSNTNNNKNNVPAAQPKAPKKSSADDLINKYTPNAAATGKARMAGDAVSEIRLGNSDYGSRIGLPPDTMFTADFQDNDGDGIDDRHQPGPGQPREESKPPTATPAAPTSASPTATPNEPRFAGELANFDSEKYYGKRTDVSSVYDTQSAKGLAGDGTEIARVNAMNDFYGTDYKDVGDFSKDQFGYWHTQHHADSYKSVGQGGDYYQRMAGDAVTEPITSAATQSAASWSPNFDDVTFSGGANQTNQRGSTTIYDNDNNKYTYSYDAGKNGSFSYTIKDQNGKTYNYEDLDDLAKSSIERYANPNYQSSGVNPTPDPTPCLLYTSPSPRDRTRSRMPSSA